jgi:hypothetical protein
MVGAVEGSQDHPPEAVLQPSDPDEQDRQAQRELGSQVVVELDAVGVQVRLERGPRVRATAGVRRLGVSVRQQRGRVVHVQARHHAYVDGDGQSGVGEQAPPPAPPKRTAGSGGSDSEEERMRCHKPLRRDRQEVVADGVGRAGTAGADARRRW